jgi:uncharacterized protein (TIGR03435 family)
VLRRIASLIPLLALGVEVAACQPAPSFEVASIRLNKNADEKGAMEFPPGGERFAATNVPLSLLIATAYGVTIPQFSWQNSALPVLSERYDVQAKADHPVSRAEMSRLLQSLLEDRFKLVVRRETRDLQSYALVVDKGGPLLHLSEASHVNDAAPLNPYHARGDERSSGYLAFKDETMSDFAFRLSTLVVLDGRVVVDKTGLDGHYDFELKFSPEPAFAPATGANLREPLPASILIAGPSIFTALREQLGLSLEPRKIPIEVLSVERAERPTEN